MSLLTTPCVGVSYIVTHTIPIFRQTPLAQWYRVLVLSYAAKAHKSSHADVPHTI